MDQNDIYMYTKQPKQNDETKRVDGNHIYLVQKKDDLKEY